MGNWIHRKYVDSQMALRVAVWQKWDWELQDTVLAKIHGVSRERVRQIRGMLKKPKAVEHRKITLPQRKQKQPKKISSRM